MERIQDGQLAMMPIEFKLNGETVVGRPDEPIMTTAKKHTASTSRTCAMAATSSDGNCRACVVVGVSGCSPRAAASRRGAWKSPPILRARSLRRRWCSSAPALRHAGQGILARQQAVGRQAGCQEDPFSPEGATQVGPVPPGNRGEPGRVHPVHALPCREVQVNDVIGYAGRGDHSKIVFDFDDPMGESTCVACGECVQACPTGALMPARGVGLQKADKTVDSVCRSAA